MKKNKAGILWIAAVACMVSVVVLLGGMSGYAVSKGNGEERIAETEDMEGTADVIDAILAEEGKTKDTDDSEFDYSFVPILTWDEYYALSPGGGNQNIAGDGVVGKISENDLSMEQAGLLGLKEVHRIFGEDMEGMRLVMWLENTKEGQVSDIWMGFLTNGINDVEMEEGKQWKSYRFDLDAVTGEILYLHESLEETEYYFLEQEETLSEEEILNRADAYVEQYGLADLSEVAGEIQNDAPVYWGKSDFEDIVLYRKNGTAYMVLQIVKKTGELRGYTYVVEGKHDLVNENEI